jgi:hypothetical protein
LIEEDDMTTGSSRPLPDNARLRRSAVGALFAGLSLMIVPVVASIRAAPPLTEAAHGVVFSFGAILVIYGVSTLTDLRAKWNKPRRHPGGTLSMTITNDAHVATAQLSSKPIACGTDTRLDKFVFAPDCIDSERIVPAGSGSDAK